MTSALKPVNSVAELVSQLPEASTVKSVMTKLGLWSDALHKHGKMEPRRPFNGELGQLSSTQLANEYAWWTSEYGRISEIQGVLLSQKVWSDLRLRQALATERTRLRKITTKDADGKTKKPTQGELNDQAEASPAVTLARQEEALVESYLAIITAISNATLNYVNTISREITRRGTTPYSAA